MTSPPTEISPAPLSVASAVVLRRISRHIRLEADHLVLALVRLSRSYIEGVNRIAVPAPTGDGGSVGLVDARGHIQPVLASLTAPATPSVPSTHAVVMLRCRRGRVVWLPSDDAWIEALHRETERLRIPVGEVFLVTEFGWRSRPDDAAGRQPTLPDPR